MKLTRTLLPAMAAAGVLAFGLSVNAATLTDGGSIGLGAADNTTEVSVTAGSQGFRIAGAGSLTAFNGTVYDYAFYDTNADPSIPTTVGPEGLIGSLSDTAGTDSKVALWTTSDPSSDPADVTNVGVRWQDNATFTVDISGLASGSVYVFNGSWQARSDWLEVAMTGTGQATVNSHSGGDTVFALSPATSGVLMNAKRVDFADASAYDTLTFTLQESTEGQNGYFAGVVVTNVTLVPEPGSLALLSLGGICVLRRRRK